MPKSAPPVWEAQGLGQASRPPQTPPGGTGPFLGIQSHLLGLSPQGRGGNWGCRRRRSAFRVLQDVDLLFRVPHPRGNGDAPNLKERIIQHVQGKRNHMIAEGVDDDVANAKSRRIEGLSPAQFLIIRFPRLMDRPGRNKDSPKLGKRNPLKPAKGGIFLLELNQMAFGGDRSLPKSWIFAMSAGFAPTESILFRKAREFL